ncbi:MAG: HAMP domain-containing histidine kinase [Deltaproteobacteria bacterium]|nr:HAMP domain-containing histidine kinase [Deltaproteobacteria bacterium]
MTAATTLAGLLLFGAYGTLLVREERRDLRASAERELTFLGTSLRVGVENAMRDRQPADVEEATLRLEGIDTEVDVFVYDLQGAPVVAPTGAPAGSLRESLTALVRAAERALETRVRYFPEASPTRLLLATPLLTDDGELVGALAISRPLDDVNEDLLATAGSTAAAVGIFVLLAMGLGIWIGETRLARPLTRLAAAMRRVQGGDLRVPVPESGDDELVAVAREFNRMMEDLRAAQAEAAREAEARREATRSLEAADRLVTVGQLSAAVAHEIGSPLQVVLGRARSLAERPDEPERVRRAAEAMVREGERITRIVEQLLVLTRRRPARREPVDVRAIAAEVLGLLEVESRRRRVTLVLAAGDPCVACCDPDQMRQLVLNLGRNALAAVAEGGRVDVTVGRTEDAATLVVADDGEGIAPELRERVFDPLFTTRADRGGTGLGLAVVRGIVLEHGGSVHVESGLGEGARFTVVLPVGAAG